MGKIVFIILCYLLNKNVCNVCLFFGFLRVFYYVIIECEIWIVEN